MSKKHCDEAGIQTGAHDAISLTRRDALRAGASSMALIAFTGESSAMSKDLSEPKEGMLTSFDQDWRFHRGDIEVGYSRKLNDTSWRLLDLPHDWGFEDVPGAPADTGDWIPPVENWNKTARRAPGTNEMVVFPEIPPAGPGAPPRPVGPFDPEKSSVFAGWTVGGIGWYRKHFDARNIALDEVVELRFDGAFKDTDVWLNGQKLGAHRYGYSGFAIDLTHALRRDVLNIVAVRVANEGTNTRWYSGSGIYRHVWLKRSKRVRIPQWGVHVVTPDSGPNHAKVQIRVDIENRGVSEHDVQVLLTIKDEHGDVVASTAKSIFLPASETQLIEIESAIASPRFWSAEQPALYTAHIALMVNGAQSDHESTRFGFRTIAVDAREGLRINGKPVKLRGACLHADNGILGARAIEHAERRKLEILKANGFNAVRCAHNLYSPAFMNACDEIGLYVIDETFDVWTSGKMGADLGASRFMEDWRDELAAMVRRDRNHPSVIMWSIGNEIPEFNVAKGTEIATQIRKAIAEMDSSRLITAAFPPTYFGEKLKSMRQQLDVVGYNYMSDVYESEHAENPGTVFLGTEQYAGVSLDAWRKVEQYPWLIGDFAWTAMDYIGEAGCGSSQLRRDGELPPKTFFPFVGFLWDYPAFLSGSGDIDILGHKKPFSHYRDVIWKRSALELFVQRPTPEGFHEELGDWAWHDELPSWTWPGTDTLTVRAYTNGDKVVLLLNGKEVESRPVAHKDRLTATFQVPYAPGELVAIAYTDGKEIGRKSLVTVGEPAKLRLRAEQPKLGSSRHDLAYVTAEVLDSDDRLIPDAQIELGFSVNGPARLLACGSANPRGIGSFIDSRCYTFHGVAQAILAPTGQRGNVILRAQAAGLPVARTTILVG